MKCPTCAKESKRSQVYVLTRHKTLLAAIEAYDEEGNLIPKEKMNWQTTRAQCSNGHQWEEKARCY